MAKLVTISGVLRANDYQGLFFRLFRAAGGRCANKRCFVSATFFIQPCQHVPQQGLHAQFMIIRSGELRNHGVGEVRGDTLARLTAPHRAFAVSCD